MFLLYKKDSVIYTTESNSDLEIIEENIENEKIITVRVNSDIELINAYIDIDFKFDKNCNLFFNGYQSWTDSFELNNKVEKNINKGLLRRKVCQSYGLNAYGDSTFYHYSRNKLHGYDLFYSKGNKSCFIYSKNHKNAYLIIEYYKNKFIRLVSEFIILL